MKKLTVLSLTAAAMGLTLAAAAGCSVHASSAQLIEPAYRNDRHTLAADEARVPADDRQPHALRLFFDPVPAGPDNAVVAGVDPEADYGPDRP